jgi:hypothetical protein
MFENELKCRLQAPYDSKENYSSNENTTRVIQRIKRAHMQYKLTKTKGQSHVLSLGAHRAAPQPKLGVFGAYHRSADRPTAPPPFSLGQQLPGGFLKSVQVASPAATWLLSWVIEEWNNVDFRFLVLLA